YKTFINFLTTFSFYLVSLNSSLYIKEGIFIIIYINNLLLVKKDKLKIIKLKDALYSKFSITNLRPYYYYLGI
ncbi:hypothetical protein M419DRAFT_93580, partial [Trichoderma reesei RUT C-30]